MSLDFDQSLLPDAAPLRENHEAGQLELELKSLFTDLFNEMSADTFDINVLGAAHLGSFDLVRRSINQDGLVVMPSASEEAATRYLYRAWNSGDVQKRGLHFLRTYLELLAPGRFQVRQLWHSKAHAYPTALKGGSGTKSWWLRQIGEPGLRVDGSWGVGRWITDPVELEERKQNAGDLGDAWLTSRIEISADIGTVTGSIGRLLPIFRSIIPARLSPDIVMWLAFSIQVVIRVETELLIDKSTNIRYPWNGVVISDRPDVMVQVGKDGSYPKVGDVKIGHFSVEKKEGYFAPWQVGGKVVEVTAELETDTDCGFWATETIPRTPEIVLSPPPIKLGVKLRQVDGSWTVGGALRIGHFSIAGQSMPTRKMTQTPRVGRFKIMNKQYPLKSNPARLAVDGSWRISGKINPVFEAEYIKEVTA